MVHSICFTTHDITVHDITMLYGNDRFGDIPPAAQPIGAGRTDGDLSHEVLSRRLDIGTARLGYEGVRTQMQGSDRAYEEAMQMQMRASKPLAFRDLSGVASRLGRDRF